MFTVRCKSAYFKKNWKLKVLSMWIIKTDHVLHFYFQNKWRAHMVHSLFFPRYQHFGSATVCFQPWARGEDKIEGSLSLTVDYISALIYSSHPLTIRVWTNTNKNNTHGPGSYQTPLCLSLDISAWQSKSGTIESSVVQSPLCGGTFAFLFGYWHFTTGT